MTDYVADVKKFTANVNEAAVAKIVKHLGIALRNKDSSLVSCSDPTELSRVRDGFMVKKLGMGETPVAAREAVLAKVCERMKSDKTKSRVTFYYLVAEETGKLGLFA